MRLLVRVALLVVLWVLAWGEPSVGNVVSGVVVAGALLVVFPLAPPTGDRIRVDARGVARLLAHVVTQLLRSNVTMSRAILRRHPTANPGVVAHRLAEPSTTVATVMTSIIALSPGTMTVDVDADASVIDVHFFSLDDVDAARAGLTRLERLVTDAVAARPPAFEPRKTT